MKIAEIFPPLQRFCTHFVQLMNLAPEEAAQDNKKSEVLKHHYKIIITWKPNMMSQGDTESKKSVVAVACSIIALLSADSL